MALRDPAKHGKGEGLEPVLPLDLNQISSFDQMLAAMSRTAFGARGLGEAADVFEAMVCDQNCRVVLTLSGAMTIAKMGLVAAEMVERGYVQAIVSTGALMCHGFVETAGGMHFKYNPEMDDTELYEKGYNRVYDTLELEENLDEIELIIREILSSGLVEMEECAGRSAVSSHSFTKALGLWLKQNTAKEARSLLKSCYEHNVPVYIPAFTDSELALDFGTYQRLRGEIAFDPFLDLEHYKRFFEESETLGIFTIGGGVPRNWAQQAGPYLEILKKRLKDDSIPLKQITYGVRICPEPSHWGGLSGCSYSEGVSWGKFVSPKEGGRFAEVHCDATIAWPILVKAVMERIG